MEVGLVQDALTESDRIFERIKQELTNARRQILVAMAWFTDPSLFSILEECLRQGIKVSLIIADQPDNAKLDFPYLESLGAEVIKIKNVGWGMMHQKFCIIDERIAITGSYNWSVNAKNNHESVIVTNHGKTVQELVKTFFNMRNRAIRINNGEAIEDIEKEESSTIAIASPSIEVPKETCFQEQSLMEFKRVLDNIVAAEVGSFDKELLKNSGYNRAQENNGDHQILPQAMDSLYSNFINEIEVIAEKKNRLKTRIDEQQKLSVANVELKTDNEIAAVKEYCIASIQNTESNINGLEKQIDEINLKVKSNKETTIPFIESTIVALKKQVNDLSVAFVKPPANKFLWWLFGVASVLLLLYLYVFYSSVAYIFMFSKGDTKNQLMSGITNIEVPEVFNAHAMSDIREKGIGGILFSILFTFIPITLGLVPLLSAPIEKEQLESSYNISYRQKLGKKISSLIIVIVSIVLVDGFMAYKVAMNINEIELLTRKTNVRLTFQAMFKESNFWLVFLLGTLGVLLFGSVVHKLYDLYCLRNATHQEAKIKYQVGVLDAEIADQLGKIHTVHLENDQHAIILSNNETEKRESEKCLQNIPIEQSDKINQLQQQLISYKEILSSIASVYKSQIDNDKLPISKAEMENRINIFMEGWSKYLHDSYAIHKAEAKTREAISEIENWLAGLSFQSEKNQTYSMSNN